MIDFIETHRDDYPETLYQGLFKLFDHVSLECLRLNRMDQIRYIGDQAKKDLEVTESSIHENDMKIKKVGRRISGMQGQTVAILGIFAGLAVGFSSRFQLLTESFSSLNSLRYTETIIYILTIGLVLYNIIFILMYCVAKISGQSISSTSLRCKEKDCLSCMQLCRTQKKLWRKYPYILLANSGFLVLVVVFIVVDEVLK